MAELRPGLRERPRVKVEQRLVPAERLLVLAERLLVLAERLLVLAERLLVLAERLLVLAERLLVLAERPLVLAELLAPSAGPVAVRILRCPIAIARSVRRTVVSTRALPVAVFR